MAAASEQEAVNTTEKKLILEVIRMYKDFSCLWDSSHELYLNKNARNQAFQIILEKWKTGNPHATIEDVKKKIEHLRAAYRRERKKVESSKSTGDESEEVYTPILWYYKYLTFLHGKTTPTSEEIDITDNEPATKKGKSTFKRQNNPYKKQEELILSASTFKRQNNLYKKQEELKLSASTLKRQNNLYKKQEELKLSAKPLINESSSHEDSSADAFGSLVSCQLKELPKLQRCIVEKMIGELLFYAKLGKLSLDASIKLNENVHTGTQPYNTPPTSHLYQLLTSPSPQNSQTSQSPKYMTVQLSQSPEYLQPSPSPQYSQTSQQSPQYTQPSPSPTHSQQSQLPKRTQHHSPSSKYTEPSPRNSRHSSLTKNTRTPADSITIYSADPLFISQTD